MKRRAFVGLLGGVAAWPLGARAQPERVRRIGVLVETSADHPEGHARVQAFLRILQQLGWSDGGNARIDYRWGASDADSARRYVAELVGLAPDVILAAGSSAVAALQQAAPKLPIVFVNVADPVGAGIVASLAQPGGNATGFTVFEYSMSGKWLELLKEVAPPVTRVAVLRDPAIAAGAGQWGVIQSVAGSFGVELSPVSLRDASEIERGVAAFARGSNRGLLVTGSPLLGRHRDLIIALAAQHPLPAVYPYPHFAAAGGLIAYGPDLVDPFGRAAGYVDRILKGEKPADLPVQAPVKSGLAVNLKTAKALGLDLPSTLLARADEVIE